MDRKKWTAKSGPQKVDRKSGPQKWTAKVDRKSGPHFLALRIGVFWRLPWRSFLEKHQKTVKF